MSSPHLAMQETEEDRIALEALQFLGLPPHRARLYKTLVEMGEGTIYHITSRYGSRTLTYRVLDYLVQLNIVQVVNKQPLKYRAVLPNKTFDEKISKMENDLNILKKGITCLQERRFYDESIAHSLMVLGFSFDESRIFNTVMTLGEAFYSQIEFYSEAPMLLRRLGRLEKCEMIEKVSNKPLIYRAVFPDKLLNQRGEKLERELETARKGLCVLQSRLGTAKFERKCERAFPGERIKQAMDILRDEYRGKVTKENIKQLNRADFISAGYDIPIATVNIVKRRLLQKLEKGEL